MDTALLSKSEQILAEVKEIYTVEDKEVGITAHPAAAVRTTVTSRSRCFQGIKYGLVKVGEFVNTLEEYLSTDRARQRQKSSEPPPKV
jgi:hypothetical protein